MFFPTKRYSTSLLIIVLWLPTSTSGSYTEIIPGLTYKQISLSNPPQSIHILRADPSLVKISLGLADNKCASARTTSEIAKQHNAVAALNAGFFGYFGTCKLHEWILALLDCFGSSNYNAFPLWTLKLHNDYYSLSHRHTGAIGWHSSDQSPLFSALKTSVQLSINGTVYPVKELNKPHTTGPVL